MSYLYKFFLGKKYADGTIDYVGDEPITIRSYSSGFFNDEFLSPFDYVAESEMREKLKNLQTIKFASYIYNAIPVTFIHFSFIYIY